ncbi:MAG TPA: hypothetical protein VFQ68_39775 [Streptosporangiaceae bacterium]|nr:hypothetical protein [Streptosporangiaceae bacterium]
MGKPGGTWLWLLEPSGDPFMMRKCPLGIKHRAEHLAAERYQRERSRI